MQQLENALFDAGPAADAIGIDGADGAGMLAAPPPFLDLFPVGMAAWAADGNLRWCSRHAAALWGDRPDMPEAVARVLRTGCPVGGEEVDIARPDGARVTVMLHVGAVRDAAGTLIGAVAACHDLRGSAREQRQLREAERRFHALLDALPAAIYTTDAAGRITYCNQAAVALAGRRPVLGIDQWCVTWRLFRPDGTPMPHDECPMAVALRENRPVLGIEAVAERPDGTRVPFLPYPTPLHDADGRLVGAVNMLVDISHRKQAETQQRILFAELNHRTKNNMQVLHALLNAARRETGSPAAQAALFDAARRVGAMAAAQKVLYQSRDAVGCSAAALLAAVCAGARQALGAGIVISCEAAAGELSNDSATPLALILNELLANAAKHALPRGEGTIRVRLTREGEQFTLLVEDDGPGFDLAEAQQRASGLGLVRGLAGQIGGALTVERQPASRCIVRFRDPAGSALHADDEERARLAASA